jgi:peptidylprolyl isomerase
MSILSFDTTRVVLATGCLVFCLNGLAAAPKAKYRSAGEIIAAAPDEHWRTPEPSKLLYMMLESGVVVVELAPQFAPAHVSNIQQLAREHFWDGTSIYRAQDNFVVQFGDVDGEDAAKAKSMGSAKSHLPAEFHRSAKGLTFNLLPDRDGWAPQVGFVDGFNAARNTKTDRAWLTHCYGTVGAGRNNADDSSTGAELYVVIGQSPRQLDDNITVVGRVLWGMERLSILKRGPGPAGFYENAGERTPIRSIRLGSDVPVPERIALQVLRTDTSTFRDAVEARRNRVDDFYKRPAGHIDLCNVSVTVREAKVPRAVK